MQKHMTVGKIEQLTTHTAGFTAERSAASKLLREVGRMEPTIAEDWPAGRMLICKFCGLTENGIHKPNCLWKRIRRHCGLEK